VPFNMLLGGNAGALTKPSATGGVSFQVDIPGLANLVACVGAEGLKRIALVVLISTPLGAC
jgi:hypothetical protein